MPMSVENHNRFLPLSAKKSQLHRIVQGLPRARTCNSEGIILNNDCWSRVLCLMSTQEIAQSFSGVCKEWRDLAYVATSTFLTFENTKPLGRGLCWRWVKDAECIHLRETQCETITDSLHCYIQKRAKTLKAILIDCKSASIIANRIFTSIERCDRLQIVDIKGPRDYDFNEGVAVRRNLPNSLIILSCDVPLKLELGPNEGEKLLQAANLSPLEALQEPAVESSHGDCVPTSTQLRVGAFLHLKILKLHFRRHQSSAPRDFTKLGSMCLQLEKLEQLYIFQIWSLQKEVGCLADHPSLRHLVLPCCHCSGETSQQVFKIPQLTVLVIKNMSPPRTHPIIPETPLLGSRLRNLLIHSLYEGLSYDLANILSAPEMESVVLLGKIQPMVHKTRLQSLQLKPSLKLTLSVSPSTANDTIDDIRSLGIEFGEIQKNDEVNVHGKDNEVKKFVEEESIIDCRYQNCASLCTAGCLTSQEDAWVFEKYFQYLLD